MGRYRLGKMGALGREEDFWGVFGNILLEGVCNRFKPHI